MSAPRPLIGIVTLVLTLVLTCSLSAAAEQAPPAATPASFPTVTLPAGADAPVIDGRVAEDAWQLAPPLTSFTQQDPFEGQPATEKTEIRLLFSATHLYVGVVCFDANPASLILSQSRRDAPLTDTESVILVFDTFNDNQNAFVFGTNPVGIEYDGQVSREGQTSGIVFGGGSGQGTQRGGITSFNPNWDGDWIVKAQVTERGWEAEMAIPLKTLRYSTGTGKTWGFNVLRNIRHKNEQVFLSPIPRGYTIYRISQAAKLTGLTLAARRDIKLIPYALGSTNRDFTRTTNQTDSRGTAGVDLKWGIRPNVTLDATVNTDFAQVEADEEQVNLTRFDLFFPEKRPFFLENASTFQFGQPQSIDLFFSRRIGLSSTFAPIDILAGTRLSGKVGQGWNIGLLNIQTDHLDDANDVRVAPATNFTVARVQKEVGRSTYGGIFVGRLPTDDDLAGASEWNRAYGLDADVQLSPSQRLSLFAARTDTKRLDMPGEIDSDHAGRAFYNFTNNLWQVSTGIAQVGDRFNPEVGFLPRKGYRRPEARVFLQYQPKSISWIRRISPHTSQNAYFGLDGQLQSSFVHLHWFEIQPASGGRFGWFTDRNQDRPLKPFVAYDRDGRQVAIAPGLYTWWQQGFEFQHNPSARVTGTLRLRLGEYYDGDFNSFEITSDYRFSANFTASVGWTRQDADLPAGAFVTNLVPVKISYSFTPRTNLSALIQHNGQTGQFSSNIRFALLDRSGTGLFVVYNDRRDFTDYTSLDTLGRSFVVKYTRLLDF